MKGDHLSFRRATGVAILGLVMQVVLGVILLIVGFLQREQAAVATACYILVGIPIWLSLAITFDQHRRERLEALEAETLERSGAAGSSVFQQTGNDLRVAARRLAWMHKYMLPGVSLGVAALLIAIGWWRWRVANDSFQVLTADISEGVSHELPIAVGLVIGVLGFVFARFVSGMGKQKIWTNLRAGAAHAVGGAVLSLGMVLAHFLFIGGSDTLFRYTQAFYPWVLIVLGGEIILNFILTIYRPRRPGEIPRPAFDSRILGFVAAPDRLAESIGGALNYQFGFDVTGSWFYQLLSRSLLMLLGVGAVVIWGMTFFAVVRPGEQGLRIRNGQLIGEPIGPGIVVKLPWPIEWVERKSTDALHRLDLGSPPPGDVKSLLWTNSHKVDEKYLIVQPSDADRVGVERGDKAAEGGEEASAARRANEIKDVSLVSVEVPLMYKVRNLKDYEALAQDGMREGLLRAAGRAVVVRYLATQKMDDVLGAGRAQASAELRALLESRYKEMNAGVEVLFVGISGVHPPTVTAARFESVVESLVQRQGSIETARTVETNTLTSAVGSVPLAKKIVAEHAVLDGMRRSGAKDDEVLRQEQKIEDLLTMAGGQAALAIQRAKADRWQQHMTARARAERYKSQLLSYKAAPQVFLSQIYFDMLGSVLREARVFVVPDDSGAPVEVRIDATEETDMSNIFKNLPTDAAGGGTTPP
jgi:regulator of protease activity HflC (stomatin/prohibitin superfamily)